MEKNIEFDDIRPYYDEEVPSVIARLLEDPAFKRVVEMVLPKSVTWESLSNLMRTYTNKYDFQHGIIKKTIFELVGRASSSVNCSGFENIQKEQAYTYISNHRDIVLDASLLACMLSEGGHDTMEVAIGDNLLLHPWIEDIVRLNKSFIVKRGVSIRQMLEVSGHLSKYIHFAIRDKKQSVWIAQREGRAKDSNDRTQESLLKMLAMGSDKSFLDSIEELNICPVSLSYEYDPCDYLKAKEFQQKRDNPEFKKSQQDDLINMEIGLFGFKGNIHFQIGRPINSIVKKMDKELPKNEQVAQLVALIDAEIFLNYKFYPINYIAYDQLMGSDLFKEKYTEEDILKFDQYLNQQLDKIDLPEKDLPYLTEKILEMYANPVKNQLSVKE